MKLEIWLGKMTTDGHLQEFQYGKMLKGPSSGGLYGSKGINKTLNQEKYIIRHQF